MALPLYSKTRRRLLQLADNARIVARLLTPRERARLAGLSVLMGLAGVVEVTSVISIVPFLAVASDPGIIERNQTLNWCYATLGFQSPRDFLLFVGSVLIGILLFTSGFQALVTYLQLRFSEAVNTSVSVRLFGGYLSQPYASFLTRNSADMQACVQTEAVYVQSALLQPLLQIIQKMISISLLLLAVIVANPRMACAAFLVYTGMYGSLFLFVRRRLHALGAVSTRTSRRRYKAVNESFGSPKLTKLMQLEPFFHHEFSGSTKILNRAQSDQQMLRQLPKFCLEAVSLSGILVVAIGMIATSERFSEVIPALGFYAFAGYRLMPAIQIIYSSASFLQFGWPRATSVYREFETLGFTPFNVTADPVENLPQPDRLAGGNLIELRNVQFTYETAAKPTLQDICLTIETNTTVGLCGATGAGKTTLVDILLGLLQPESGALIVDGARIGTQNCQAWQKQIGYVPQDIVLTDNSIAENIAFGVEQGSIDLSRLRRASKLAGILDFIEETLPEAFATKVGERGIRLSGGQRQRIGIARALYREPRVLVFDEATSSLDTETEQTVMGAISGLAHKMTIVLIAHRINTLRACDTIFRLEAGRIVQSGSFAELFETPASAQVASAISTLSHCQNDAVSN